MQYPPQFPRVLTIVNDKIAVVAGLVLISKFIALDNLATESAAI